MTEPTTINPKKSLVHTFKTQQFGGIIVEEKTTGHKRLKLNAEQFYRHAVNKMKTGEAVTMYLTNKRPKRTEQQNRYYWFYLTLVSQETGEQNVDRLHELFKGLFLTETITKVLGRDVRIRKSTTDLSVIEFGEYITAIENETGVQAPPPESYDLAPLRNSTDSVQSTHGSRPKEVVEDFLPETSGENTTQGFGLEKAKHRRNQKKTT